MVIPLTYGRMGNFLFQAAAAMAYAWKHELEFTLPNHTKDPQSNPIYLQHLVNRGYNPRLPAVKLVEKGHGYQEIPFKKAWSVQNIVLDGYWQSEKYFKDYRDRIIKTFGYPWRLWSGFVSFHVRRGDYLNLPQKHPPVSLDWMHRAMAKFPGYHFIFFSDDLEWCKQTFGHRADVTISPKRGEEEDLIHISCCEHHICSASTFSWWGAWLNRNPNKRVIMPVWWFQPGYQNLDTRDIVPPEWERMT